MFHKEIEDHEIERMVRVLNVSKFRKGSIAGIPTVGSVAVITDKGGVVHPDVSDDELEGLSKFFEVPLDVGTVNFGVAFIKTGLVANNYGALVGERTTGPEIMRIMKALNMR
jgi:translation initiation factor 6